MIKNKKYYTCDFCRKNQDQVKKIIAGPDGVAICDECVGACNEVLADEKVKDFTPLKHVPDSQTNIPSVILTRINELVDVVNEIKNAGKAIKLMEKESK